MNPSFLFWAIPAGFVISGIILGMIFQKIILRKLKKSTRVINWHGDVVINALQHWIVFWFILAGIYGAIHSLSFSADHLKIFNKILLILTIISATTVIARIAGGFVRTYQESIKDVIPSTTLFTNLTKLIVFLIGSLVMLRSLGISIAPILATLGVGGLAVALALQDVLSNLFSGIHIILSKKIKPGNYVRLDSGEEGYIVDITWRDTTLRELSDNQIIVPNLRLARATIKNYNLPDLDLSVPVEVGVCFDSDLEKVERVTQSVAQEVMKEVPGGVPEFEPAVRFHSFGDSSIQLKVALRAKNFSDQYLLKHEFIKRLQKRYQQEGIVIPFPVRTVKMDSAKIVM